ALCAIHSERLRGSQLPVYLSRPVLNVQPISLSFSDELREGFPGTRIEISMDGVRMQDSEPPDPLWVSLAADLCDLFFFPPLPEA
uniref:Uncharacterized protein n=1 Tax=Callorhinchus milii TaxID=7868 RepID=A0A4W3H5T6_CALMI